LWQADTPNTVEPLNLLTDSQDGGIHMPDPSQRNIQASRSTVKVWPPGEKCPIEEHQELITEEPLSIHVDGKPYSVVMRTPGEENFHVAGFCLSEGIIDRIADIAASGYCTEMDGHVATLTLQPERRDAVLPLLQRRGFVSQTSCGICGKEMIRELRQILHPVSDNRQVRIGDILTCMQTLLKHQKLHAKTRATHAAALFDDAFHMIAMSEDVGRHNALDKAIGKALIHADLSTVLVGVLSSRISYELVQKAARARIPVLIAMSRPTALAVQLAQDLDMTIARHNERYGGLAVYCGFDRIVGGNDETTEQKDEVP
jgi:FdhD protein